MCVYTNLLPNLYKSQKNMPVLYTNKFRITSLSEVKY